MKKGIIGGLGIVIGVLAGSVITGRVSEKNLEKKSEKVNKFKSYYNMLNQWLVLKGQGKSLEEYFTGNGYKTIAIYGMGEMGNRLYEELKDSDIEIQYAIDKAPGAVYSELEVREAEEEMDKVDVVIVTATFAYDEIKEELEDKFTCPIISLEDVICELAWV